MIIYLLSFACLNKEWSDQVCEKEEDGEYTQIDSNWSGDFIFTSPVGGTASNYGFISPNYIESPKESENSQ